MSRPLLSMKGEDKLANKSQSNFLLGSAPVLCYNAEMERMALLLYRLQSCCLKSMDDLRIYSLFAGTSFESILDPF